MAELINRREQKVAELINHRFFDTHQQAIGTQEGYLGRDKVPAKCLSIKAESRHISCHKCRWGCHLQLPWGGKVHSWCRQDAPQSTSVTQEPPTGDGVFNEKQPAYTAGAHGHYWMLAVFVKTRHSRECWTSQSQYFVASAVISQSANCAYVWANKAEADDFQKPGSLRETASVDFYSKFVWYSILIYVCIFILSTVRIHTVHVLLWNCYLLVSRGCSCILSILPSCTYFGVEQILINVKKKLQMNRFG